MAIPEFDRDRDAWLGDPSKPLRVVLYGDYTCEVCRTAHTNAPDLAPLIVDRGVFIYRQRPSASRLPASNGAALAALAAQRQDAFWEMHERLYAAHDQSEAALRAHAEALSLDLERFDRDRADPALHERLRAALAGVEGEGPAITPSLFINGVFYDGPWDLGALQEAMRRPGLQKARAAAEGFFGWAAAGGLVLVLATLAALLFVNLGGMRAYEHWLELELAASLGEARYGLPLEAWINDGLMAIFFLLIGIEIKREILDGELSDPASAALPLIAALGGMLAPALIYAAFNVGGPAAQGWGVPMATDIAFAVGLLALLGSKAPPALKVFVSALAVADDLGAILVIAIFYGHGFDLTSFALAAAVLGLMIILNLRQIYARAPYLLLGLALWFFVHESGLHATLAGVLTAAAIPSRPKGDIAGIAAQTTVILEHAAQEGGVRANMLHALERAIDRLREPGYHIERRLQRAVNFAILPLFAFANTGILLVGSSFSLMAPESLGVILGLTLGKPIGVAGLGLLAVWLGWARLPTGVTAAHMLGAGFLAGVGFTMSIFIADAAFVGAQLEAVKLSVLIASVLSAVIGVAILASAGAGEAAPATEKNAA
ncbi:MAG: Na+/H+ antiporter NhaA [Pseudomonadota bacterium]